MNFVDGLANIATSIANNYPILPKPDGTESTKIRRSVLSDIQLRLAEIKYICEREQQFLNNPSSEGVNIQITKQIYILCRCIFTKFKVPYLFEDDKVGVDKLMREIIEILHDVSPNLIASYGALQKGVTGSIRYKDARSVYERTINPGHLPGTLNINSSMDQSVAQYFRGVNQIRDKLDSQGTMTEENIINHILNPGATPLYKEFVQSAFGQMNDSSRAQRDPSEDLHVRFKK